MTHERLAYLLNKYSGKSLAGAEKKELKQFLDGIAENGLSEELINPLLREQPSGHSDYLSEAGIQRILQSVLELDRPENKVFTPVVHRVHFLRRSWFRYAAAIILIAGAAAIAIVVSSRRQSSGSGMGVAKKDIPTDILPGTNKAVLTVDNKKIDLSPDKTGIRVGNDVAYTDGEKLSEGGKMLVLTTPNGGQYQLVLPDGTKAWLNAASSISFPSAFNDGKRQIKITGEVYLEVAKDKSKPFLVDVNGQSTVEVLGTGFNINSYDNEYEIKTTLVEGSVRVLNTVAGGNDHIGQDVESVILNPGQQSVIQSSRGESIRVQSADLSQTLAWKNGLFSFNNADLPSAMKQLERWYDIKVRYEREVSDIRLGGKMYRNVNLSDVLNFFEEYGVKFRREGKILVVL